MKTPSPFPFRPSKFPPHPRHTRSAALLIVLGCLALISVLIVAFFSSVTTERQSAQIYANTSSVKLLADSTVSIVMGTIKDATKGTNAAGNIVAWASQPGMIRNYSASSANAIAYYKLYSWNSMVTATFDPINSAAEVPPMDWTASPAVYTDLNEPVSGVYPIVDPSATTMVKGFSLSTTATPVSTQNTAPMPVKWLYALKNGQVIAPDPTSTGKTATFTTSAVQPSATNSIVGRIAFWTDDDTCKVNVNTAAGDVWVDANGTSSMPAIGADTGNPGSFWDTPRIFNTNELKLASYQAANGEYQRYPGHPATTYLSAVFPTNFTKASQIYQLSPRVTLGGSYSGSTYPTSSMVGLDDNDRLYSSVDEFLWAADRTVNSPLSKDSIQKAKFFLTATSRAPEVNLLNQPRVVIWPMSPNTTVGTYRTAYDNLIAYCGSLYCTNALNSTLTTNAYYFQRDNPNSVVGSAVYDLPTTATTTGLGRNRSLISYLRALTTQPIPGFSTIPNDNFRFKFDLGTGGVNGERDQILTEIFDYIRTVNTQDPNVTKSFTPHYGETVPGAAVGAAQVVPITDTGGSANNIALRGFGHMPVITEYGLMYVGVGEASGTVTNYFPGVYPGAGRPPLKNTTRIQPVFYVKLFDPAAGYGAGIPNYQVAVSGLNNLYFVSTATNNFGLATNSMGFPIQATVKVNAFAANWWPPGYQGVAPVTQGTGFTASTTGFVGTNTIDAYNTNTSAGTPAVFFATSAGSAAGPFSSTAAPVFTPFTNSITININDPSGATNYQTYANLQIPGGIFPVPRQAPLVADPSHISDWGTNAYADFRNLGSASATATAPSGNVTAFPRFTPYGTIANWNTLQTTITGEDVVRSMVLTTDPRIIAGTKSVPRTWFSKINNYDSALYRQTHGILAANNGSYRPFVGAQFGKLVAGASYNFNGIISPFTTNNNPSDIVLDSAYVTGVQPFSSATVNGIPKGPQMHDPDVFIAGAAGVATTGNGVTLASGSEWQAGRVPGDWDTGVGAESDGGFINKVDEGTIPYSTQYAYFGGGYHTDATGAAAVNGTITISSGACFSPNRMLPSAGMFGSLSTGVKSSRPWQTLLFRPSPDGTTGSTATHVGARTPKDHLILDLFNMPIVEPYAITDPFSTAGKINLNYQMVPFNKYMTRTTALQAVMRSEQMLVLPVTAKVDVVTAPTVNYRHYIDIDETLKQFDVRFTNGDIFRSASEICDIWLIPAAMGQQYTLADMQAFWTPPSGKGALTGDNVRERPYANLYPRLTTKSNSYTVHMRVQTLKKVNTTDPTTWVDGTDVVTGEYRGSSSLERYLDTSDKSIPDYATEVGGTYTSPTLSTKAIDNYYKFRVVETKQFTP